MERVVKLSRFTQRILWWELFIPTVLLVLGVYHGLLQTLYRAGIIQSTSFLGLEYYQGLTLHGVINAVVYTTFFAVAFGNALFIYYLEKEPKPLWNGLSFGLMTLGTILAAIPMLSGDASVLYTFYPPLKAHPAFYIGAALLIVGSWVAFFNWIPLYLEWHRENPDKKIPLAILGIMATFIIWLVATAAVAVEVLFMLIPWSLGWINTINIPLSRTLFWFFGHPLVYFWLLPVYIMYYVMLPKLSGGKLFSDNAARLVFLLFIVFSIPVGVHHQFTEPGLSKDTKLLHSLFTFFVAVPSLITAFTVAASLEHGAWSRGARGLFSWMFKQPYWDKDKYLFPYLVMGLVIFIFGGFTGIVNASYNMNLVVHNTSWISGHFHLTVAGPVILGMLGMALYMMEHISGRRCPWRWGAMVFPYLWTIGLAFLSTGLMIGGLHGEPRRTNLGITYLNPQSDLYRPDWETWTTITAIGGVILFIAALVYFIAFFGTLIWTKAGDEVLYFPTSEPLHEERKVAWLNQLAPWIMVLIFLIVVAYTPAIVEVLENTYANAPGYTPANPLPQLPNP